VNTVAMSFNTAMGQITEMCKQKKTAYRLINTIL